LKDLVIDLGIELTMKHIKRYSNMSKGKIEHHVIGLQHIIRLVV